MNWEKDDIFLSKWLNEELSEEEKSAFEATEEGKEFVALMKASSLISPSTYKTEAELQKLTQRIQSTPQAKQKAIWMQTGFQLAVAASVALIIAVIYIFSLGAQTIETGFSEQEIVMLPDGSEAKLNSVSQLSYDKSKWEEERFLELDGEAFFQVKKGAQFTVQTANGNIQVLGTSFNVRSRGALLDVVCYTGRVEVTSSNMSRQLTPGEMVRVNDGEMISFKKSDLATSPSWTSGIIQLENVSLSTVLDELRFTFGFEVEYDGSLDQLLYTGAFPTQKAESALKLVFEPLDIDYSYHLPSKKLIIHGLNK